jgi:chlorobactene glucosyltransferase
VLAFVVLRVRLPTKLPRRAPAAAPLVSVIVPARDEAVNIGTCVGSLAASTYPDFEIIIVDDQSADDTAERARAVGPGNARRLEVVRGTEVPTGWLGKPWACWQGARATRGEILLFTDADTVHGPDLLTRAVAELQNTRADVVTVMGHQIMGSFWERLVQPQVFLLLVVRFINVERAVATGRWRGAIANGQFLLFTQEAYDALGGHEAVKHEVVEDLMLAQLIVRRGRTLVLRSAERSLSTRMYRSLGELVAGWSKNIFAGGLRSLPPSLRTVAGPVSALTGFGLWLAPPLVLAATFVGAGGAGLRVWAAAAVVSSVVLWAAVTARMRGPFWYGLLYPLGAAVGLYIFMRSWARGRHVEWKGRAYVLGDSSDVP